MSVVLTPIERRVLAYLDQHGPTHRQNVVHDLASPDSRAARGWSNGSNGAVPLIMGKWCSRLVKLGYVQCVRERVGYYDHHKITGTGKALLRSQEIQS